MLTFNSLVLFFLGSVIILWRRPQWWPQLLMVFLGVLSGLMCLRTDDVPVNLFFLVGFGFFGGFAQGNRPWLLALLLGVWAPALSILAHVLGASPDHFNVAGPFVAFVPAFAGTYLGAFVKQMSAKCFPATT
jgi:hypothetical protein